MMPLVMQLSLMKVRPTKRAPDKWDSARFTNIFLASDLYSPQVESTLRPLAGNASRWAVELKTSKSIELWRPIKTGSLMN